MIQFILIGTNAVSSFFNEDWDTLESDVLECSNGDIISIDTLDPNYLSELLNSISGWNDYQLLNDEDITRINTNTNIKIQHNG